MRLALITVAALGAAQPAFAQGIGEKRASEAEFVRVREELAKIGRRPEDIAKEIDRTFTIEDAQCTIGQYDIKVGDDFKIISITSDD